MEKLTGFLMQQQDPQKEEIIQELALIRRELKNLSDINIEVTNIKQSIAGSVMLGLVGYSILSGFVAYVLWTFIPKSRF